MNFNVGDRLKTKPCWTDVYFSNSKQIYVIEYIQDDWARLRGLDGQIAITSIETINEIFTNTL